METLYTDSEGRAYAKRVNGTYSYNIAKSGYDALSDSVVVSNSNVTIEDNLISIWILDQGTWDNSGIWSNNSV